MTQKNLSRLQRLALSAIFLIGIASVTGCAGPGQQQQTPASSARWTESFDLEECSFSSTGKNKYFLLEPGYQLTLEGLEGQDTVELVITVLNQTQKIGDIETRVVEERESANGKLAEISRNYLAICTPTNSVFYFGEEVDVYKQGEVVGHGGAWRAGSEGAQAGLMMPGIILLGSRYHQELAPGVAMDRAEIVSRSETVQTPVGMFEDCLKIEETNPLEPQAEEYKFYAPEIGLIKDGNLLLTSYGFIPQ